MDYDLYHDESQIGGYWHGMLLVPRSSLKELTSLLDEARSLTKYSHPLSFKSIRKTNRGSDCARAWASIGVAAMRSLPKGPPIPYSWVSRSPRNGSTAFIAPRSRPSSSSSASVTLFPE
jgi:hypothetical protein